MKDVGRRCRRTRRRRRQDKSRDCRTRNSLLNVIRALPSPLPLPLIRSRGATTIIFFLVVERPVSRNVSVLHFTVACRMPPVTGKFLILRAASAIRPALLCMPSLSHTHTRCAGSVAEGGAWCDTWGS